MTAPASRLSADACTRSLFWAEGTVWLLLAAGLALNTAFSLQFFGTKAVSGGLTLPLPGENQLWASLSLVLLGAAVWVRFFGKGTGVNADSTAVRHVPLLAALVLDILALAVGTPENGAARVLASGFVRSGLWSVPLMTFAIGLRLGDRVGGNREGAFCLAALLLHTVLLAKQPDLFSVLVQWAALAALACFAPAARRARRALWLAAAGVFVAVACHISAMPYLSRRVTAWFGQGEDAYAAAFRQALHEAGAWGLSADPLATAVQALPAGAAHNAFTSLCLWLGIAGGAGYVLACAVFLGAAAWTARSVKSASLRLGVVGGGIALALSQLLVVAGELGMAPPAGGFGLAFLGGWQVQAALTAVWLCAAAALSVRGTVRGI